MDQGNIMMSISMETNFIQRCAGFVQYLRNLRIFARPPYDVILSPGLSFPGGRKNICFVFS